MTFYADLRAEIDFQLEGRLARLRKRLSLDDRAHANVDALEISKFNSLGHYNSLCEKSLPPDLKHRGRFRKHTDIGGLPVKSGLLPGAVCELLGQEFDEDAHARRQETPVRVDNGYRFRLGIIPIGQQRLQQARLDVATDRNVGEPHDPDACEREPPQRLRAVGLDGTAYTDRMPAVVILELPDIQATMGRDGKACVPLKFVGRFGTRRQRSAAMADATRRAIGVIWRFLLNRKSRQEHDACAGVSRTCTP